MFFCIFCYDLTHVRRVLRSRLRFTEQCVFISQPADLRAVCEREQQPMTLHSSTLHTLSAYSATHTDTSAVLWTHRHTLATVMLEIMSGKKLVPQDRT